MEQAFNSIISQVVGNLAPMFIFMVIVVLVFGAVVAKVRSPFSKRVAGVAATLTWLGMMTTYYKVV